MSTDTRFRQTYKAAPTGFLADPAAYVIRIYPPTEYTPEIVFLPLLKNGREAGRWEGRFLTGEQYQQLLAAIRAVLEPAPVCAVRGTLDQEQSAAQGERDLRPRVESEVS